MSEPKATLKSITNENVKEAHKQQSNSTELLKRHHIDDSPFMVITNTEEGFSYGVMGKYRMTNVYSSEEECIEEMKKITWNRIIQVIICLNHDHQNREDLINKLNEQ